MQPESVEFVLSKEHTYRCEKTLQKMKICVLQEQSSNSRGQYKHVQLQQVQQEHSAKCVCTINVIQCLLTHSLFYTVALPSLLWLYVDSRALYANISVMSTQQPPPSLARSLALSVVMCFVLDDHGRRPTPVKTRWDSECIRKRTTQENMLHSSNILEIFCLVNICNALQQLDCVSTVLLLRSGHWH